MRIPKTLLVLATATAASLSAAEREVLFNRDIRPILNTSCTGCHGGVKKSASVSFIYRDEALGVSSNGKKIIIPGDPENSEVVKRITSTDPR